MGAKIETRLTAYWLPVDLAEQVRRQADTETRTGNGKRYPAHVVTDALRAHLERVAKRKSKRASA
jgi:hypothetical protein